MEACTLRVQGNNRGRAGEEQGKSTSSSTDGCTLYRALARLLAHDPGRFASIRDEIIRAATYCRYNNKHPSHEASGCWEAALRLNNHSGCSELYAAFESPDLACGIVLEAIAQLLNIDLRVYSMTARGWKGAASGELVETYGDREAKPVAVLRQFPDPPSQRWHGIGTIQFSSLLPDQSGKALVEYLQATRECKLGQYQEASARNVPDRYGSKSLVRVQWSKSLQPRPPLERCASKATTS